MSGLIGTAAAQYANRPKDESFADLPALIEAARIERANSVERSYNLKDLHVAPTVSGTDVQLVSPRGGATFSHWAFGQTARMIGAPSGYLRTLPPSIVADAVNHGIRQTPAGTTAIVLAKANGNGPIVRSITSESYGRLWDQELYDAAQRNVFTSRSVSGDAWIAPPTWAGDTAGTWRGDRDSFVIRVDGGSIVTDPSVSKDGRMYRGILIRNSEVGAASVVIDWVLFEYICGNLNLWGAVVDRRFSRRHVGIRVLRDTIRELSSLAHQWTNRSAKQDEAIIRTLIGTELAHTKETVIDELRAIGYTKDQAESAYLTCERTFEASPRSYWGLAQGTTRDSQTAGYQDERYSLDQLAAKLMAKGARAKVAA